MEEASNLTNIINLGVDKIHRDFEYNKLYHHYKIPLTPLSGVVNESSESSVTV